MFIILYHLIGYKILKVKGKQEQHGPDSFSLRQCGNNTDRRLWAASIILTMSVWESMMSVKVLHISDN